MMRRVNYLSSILIFGSILTSLGIVSLSWVVQADAVPQVKLNRVNLKAELSREKKARDEALVQALKEKYEGERALGVVYDHRISDSSHTLYFGENAKPKALEFSKKARNSLRRSAFHYMQAVELQKKVIANQKELLETSQATSRPIHSFKASLETQKLSKLQAEQEAIHEQLETYENLYKQIKAEQ